MLYSASFEDTGHLFYEIDKIYYKESHMGKVSNPLYGYFIFV